MGKSGEKHEKSIGNRGEIKKSWENYGTSPTNEWF